MERLQDAFEVDSLLIGEKIWIFTANALPSVTDSAPIPNGSICILSNGEIFSRLDTELTVGWILVNGPIATGTTGGGVTVAMDELVVMGPNGPELVFTDDSVVKVEVANAP